MKILIIDKNDDRCVENVLSTPDDHTTLGLTAGFMKIRKAEGELSDVYTPPYQVDLILCHLDEDDQESAEKYSASVKIFYAGGGDGYDSRAPEKALKIWRKVESDSPVTSHEWKQLLAYTTCKKQVDSDCSLPPCVLSPIPLDQFFALKILADAYLQARLQPEDKCPPQVLRLLKSAEDGLWWMRALRVEPSSDGKELMKDWGNAWRFNQSKDIVDDWESVEECINNLLFNTAAEGQRDVNSLVTTLAVHLEKRLKCR